MYLIQYYDGHNIIFTREYATIDKFTKTIHPTVSALIKDITDYPKTFIN